jgi:hypothetical protein
MAKRLGPSWSNKRNREIFGPSWERVMVVIGISVLLLILLFWMFGGEEGELAEAPEEEEEALEDTEAPVGQPAEEAVDEGEAMPEQAALPPPEECPLPSIPIVDFTEDELYGDTSGDDILPGECKDEVEASKRRLSKLFSNAKNDEQGVLNAEQRLGESIAELEETLDRLYAEREALEQARECSGMPASQPEETEEIIETDADEAQQEAQPEEAEEPAIVR